MAKLLSLLILGSAAHAAELRSFKLEKPTLSPPAIRFAVPYTLGTHEGFARDAEGEVNVEWPNVKVVGGRFRVAVLDLDADNDKRSCHLREALGLDYSVSEYPKIHVCGANHQLPVTGKDALAYSWITFTQISSVGEAPAFDGTKPVTLQLKGWWNIHGVSRERSFPAELSVDPKDAQLLRLKAELPFQLSEHGVKVKPLLFIKVQDDVLVRLDLRFRRKI